MVRLLVAALAAAAAAVPAAHAALSVSAVAGGGASGPIRENFDDLPLGAAGGFTATGIEVRFGGDAGAVQGALANRHARPVLSGLDGVGFGAGGGDQPVGADQTTYLSSGSTLGHAASGVELRLPGLFSYFGLLWGSIDAYNTLSFWNGDTLIGALTGADVVTPASGDQGLAGTRYVGVTSDLPFNRVTAVSSNYAFEFDNVSLDRRVDTEVPAAGMGALLGLGAAGLMLRRRAR